MEESIRKLLIALGESPERPGLERTPARVAASWREMTSGIGCDERQLLAGATFPAESRAMVVCRDIHFVSICEHHLLPFFGTAHIAYLPGDVLVGISKLVRLAQTCARRLQVQERMGQQILDAMEAELSPRGIMVHIEALHLCMVARGVRQEKARMVTLNTSGGFELRPELTRLAIGD